MQSIFQYILQKSNFGWQCEQGLSGSVAQMRETTGTQPNQLVIKLTICQLQILSCEIFSSPCWCRNAVKTQLIGSTSAASDHTASSLSLLP